MKISVKNESDSKVIRMQVWIGSGHAVLNGKETPIEIHADCDAGMTFSFPKGRSGEGSRETFRVECGSVVPRLLLMTDQEALEPDSSEKGLIERAIRALEDLVAVSSVLGAAEDESILETARKLVAERDALRVQAIDLLPEADAKQHFATRAIRAETRLRSIVERILDLKSDLHKECDGPPTMSRQALVEFVIDALARAINGNPG